MDVNGEAVAVDEMGPVVVNKDGSLSRCRFAAACSPQFQLLCIIIEIHVVTAGRISNWATMTEGEQNRTLKRIAKRNKVCAAF